MKLKIQRIMKGMTQGDLSKITGINQNKISRAERRTDLDEYFSYREAIALSKALGVEFEELLDKESENNGE